MNHTLKSIAPFVFLVIIFGVESVYGQNSLSNKKHEFSLSGGIGFFSGTSYEIVYKYADENEYLSELQWNIKPLFYMGIALNYDLKEPAEERGFLLGIGLKAGIPMQTGSIKDRDWLLFSEDLTHYSSHENHTKAAVLLNVSTGYSLPVWKMVLKFYLNFDFMYFKWEARNGYIQYGPNKSTPYIPWDASFPKEPSSGLGITYTQHWVLFSAGIGADFPMGRFTFFSYVSIGPAICIAVDDHHKTLPPVTFIDTVYKGLYVKPKLGAYISCNSRFDIGMSVMYTYISETRGNTIQKNNGYTSGNISNTAGAAFKAFEGNLSVKYRL